MNLKGIDDILNVLPHRYPFLLVDRITGYEEGKWIEGYKNVTIDEIFFMGHFPHYPVMPGVLIIESMAQTAGLLFMKKDEKDTPLFLGIDKLRFKKQVRPGDRLDYRIDVKSTHSNIVIVSAIAKVDGEIAVKGDLMLGVQKRG